MPLTAVIVDDESLARQELRYLLERTGDVTIVAEASNGIEAVQVVRTSAPDALFMDVQMPGLDGFGVLKQLVGDGRLRMPEVVFATAFDHYAVRAFEVNAIDYLLKPFEERRVALAVQKLRSRALGNAAPSAETRSDTVPQAAANTAPRSRPGKVVLRAGQRLLLADQHDICFASIAEGIISVVTPAMEGLSNVRTLEELSDQLDAETFWRAHRSYLVNIQHIREVVPWFKSSYLLRMDDRGKTEIPVARAQVKRLRELFNL